MAKISLNLNQNTKHEHEMCKKINSKVQIFILITCETWIWNEMNKVMLQNCISNQSRIK
jgi:hypothetical protein